MQAETASGWGPSDEMCNMYTMVWSRLPYFQLCGNGVSQVPLGKTTPRLTLLTQVPSTLRMFVGFWHLQAAQVRPPCAETQNL